MADAGGRDRGDEATDAPPPRQRRSQRERRERTREALIEATIELIAEAGYSKLTVQQIARRAGVTTGALQHHFGSKGELMQAAVARLFFGITGPLEASNLPPTLAGRCRHAVETYWTIFGQPRYFVVWEIILEGRTDPDFWPQTKAFQRYAVECGQVFFRALFGDYVSDPARLDGLLHLCSSSLRGVALLQVFDEPRETIERHKRLITRALYDAVRRVDDGLPDT